MKTIEEAAREAVRKEYLCESCPNKDACDFCGGENTAFDCCECPADSYEDGFKAGANHIMSLPLAERLTAEEREKIKQWDVFMRKKRDEAFVEGNLGSASVSGIAVVAMRDIFGKEMFEEEGGSRNDPNL